MAAQDWKTGGLNRSKYVIRKSCRNCDGEGSVLDKGAFFESQDCPECDGAGSLPVDVDARYFVLRIDSGPDGPHDPNAKKALACYANSVEAENPIFAADIRVWLTETADP